MADLRATIVFDASSHSDHQTHRGAGPHPDHYWKAVVALVLTAAVVTLYSVASGPDFELRVFAALVILLMIFVSLTALSYFYPDFHEPPVRLYSDGTLEIGRKKWPMADVSEIVVDGRIGPVLFKSKNGKNLALVTGTQIVNVSDFTSLVRREYPHIAIRIETRPVKVRIGKQ